MESMFQEKNVATVGGRDELIDWVKHNGHGYFAGSA